MDTPAWMLILALISGASEDTRKITFIAHYNHGDYSCGLASDLQKLRKMGEHVDRVKYTFTAYPTPDKKPSENIQFIVEVGDVADAWCELEPVPFKQRKDEDPDKRIDIAEVE